MRFTIMGFRQSTVVANKITAKELVFLRWFIDFMVTMRMKWVHVGGQTYFWIDNSTVLEELPILGISQPHNLRRFLSGMVKKALLKYHLRDGNKPYYAVNSDTASELLSSKPIPRKKRR